MLWQATNYNKDDFEAVIGLETHVELSTKAKCFVVASYLLVKSQIKYTCPVCLGHPGSLPVVNKGQ